MFLPKTLLELEALLPRPLPPVLRRFLARRPQGQAFARWMGYPRPLVLAHYRERQERGADAHLLPIGRSEVGELLVHLTSLNVLEEKGRELLLIADDFAAWLASERTARKRANGQPLHRAARGGNLEALRRLLRRGAPLDAGDTEGHTPLQAALLAWQYEAAALLLDAGADPNRADRAGHTALMWAAYRNRPALVQALIDRGADVQARTRSGEGLLYFALTGPRSVTEGGSKGSRDTVEILLAAGLSWNSAQLPGDKPITELDPSETGADLWAWVLGEAGREPAGS